MAFDFLFSYRIDPIRPYIILEIPGKPIPWKVPRITRYGAFSPNKAQKDRLREYAASAYSGNQLTGAVYCALVFFMPIPKSFSDKKRADALNGLIFPVTRPDRTNMCKLYEDLLNGIVWRDDSQIVDGFVRKEYSETPKTMFVIQELWNSF